MGREVGGHDGLDAGQAQGGDDRQPDGTRAHDQGSLARRDLGAGNCVQPHRHGLGEGGAAGVEPVGDLEQEAGRQHHALGVPTRVVVGVTDGVHAALVGDDRHGHDRLSGRDAGRVGPQLDDLGGELVAHHHVPPGLEDGHGQPVDCSGRRLL